MTIDLNQRNLKKLGIKGIDHFSGYYLYIPQHPHRKTNLPCVIAEGSTEKTIKEYSWEEIDDIVAIVEEDEV